MSDSATRVGTLPGALLRTLVAQQVQQASLGREEAFPKCTRAVGVPSQMPEQQGRWSIGPVQIVEDEEGGSGSRSQGEQFVHRLEDPKAGDLGRGRRA